MAQYTTPKRTITLKDIASESWAIQKNVSIVEEDTGKTVVLYEYRRSGNNHSSSTIELSTVDFHIIARALGYIEDISVDKDLNDLSEFTDDWGITD